jgi:gliding motility-associated-like protein
LAFNTLGVFKIKVRISTSCCGYSPYDSIYIIVEANPTLAFNGPLGVCPGDTTTLIASGASYYWWTPPLGLDTIYGSTVQASPGVTTTYLVRGYSQRLYCIVDSLITVQVTNPPALTFTTNPATCGGNGSVTVVPSPAGSYSYLWNDPNAQTVATATNLSPGSYAVSVVDNNSTCSATDGTALGSGTGVQAFIDSSADVSCFGLCDGVARVRGILGSGTFSYNWSNGGSTALVSGLCANTYNVTVTDVGNNCTATATITINQPALLTIDTLYKTDATCPTSPDGEALVNAAGGTGPYQYLWNDTGQQDSAHAIGLVAGLYTPTVIDQNGCTVSMNVTITSPPATITLGYNSTNVNCFGGSDGAIDLTISSTNPYTILWDTPNADTTEDVSGLPSGYYSVQVKDSTNCVAPGGDSIFISQPTQLAIDTTLTEISCFGANDGCISIAVSGGVPGYTIDWSNSSTANQICNLSPGNYGVTATDANNCTVSIASINVVEPPLLTLNPAINPLWCVQFNDASISVNPTGGTPGYTYNWSPVAGNFPSIINLGPGSYAVTVTDLNGCSVDSSFTLDLGSVFAIEAYPADTTIKLGQIVQLNTVTTSGNIGNVLWQPSNGLDCSDCISPISSPLKTITYLVTALSDSGCYAWDSVHITVIPTYEIFIPNVFTPNGDGSNDFFEVFGNKNSWKQFEIMIFDRWGEKVYESQDMNFKWDGFYKGVLLPPAVFVYTVNLVFLDNYVPKLYKGSITLLR